MIKKRNIKNKKKLFLWTAIPLIAITLIVFIIHSYMPLSLEEMKRSVAIAECQSYYELRLNGTTIIYFNGMTKDSTFIFPSTKNDEACKHIEYSTTCWANRLSFIPSCNGLLLMPIPFGEETQIHKLNPNTTKELILKELKILKNKNKILDSRISELNYYIKIHKIQDEGYIPIAQYNNKSKEEKQKIQNLIIALKKIKTISKAEIKHTVNYKVIYKDEDNKYKIKNCHYVGCNIKLGFLLIQTDEKTTPSYAIPIFFHNMTQLKEFNNEEIISSSYCGLKINGFLSKKARIILTTGKIKKYKNNKLKTDIPTILAENGSPVFNKNGLFIGICHNGNIIKGNEFGYAFRNLIK